MKKLFLVALVASLVAPIANAQFGGAASKAAALKAADWQKVFGKNDAFTATSLMKVQGKKGKDLNMTTKLAYLEGKMRTEMDLAQMQTSDMPPQAIAQMKQMGMDKTLNIVRPDQKKMYLVYPGVKAYVEMALPEEETKSLESKVKVDKTELGKETVDGHPCIKNKLTVTDENGKASEFTLWNATDMKDFPVKVETVQEDTTISITYKDVQFAKPDAKDFEPPTDFAKHENMQQLMMQQMMKMQKP